MRTNHILLISLCASVALAQTPSKKSAFEVATIKLNTSGDGRALIDGGQGTGGRLRVTNLPLRQLIALAYADRSKGNPGPGGGANITGGPGWVATDRYDIEARPEDGAKPTQEQFLQMLQSLLEDRFALKVRKEVKDGPIYELVVAKGGVANKPGLKLSEDQTPPTFGPPPGGATPAPPPPGPNGPPGTRRGGGRIGLGELQATAQTMEGFAPMLSGSAGRKVVDKTGLTGLYDIVLKWTPDQIPANLPPDVPFPRPDPNGPSLFTALQEQLGLKLEPGTGPLESIVIESVSKPTEN